MSPEFYPLIERRIACMRDEHSNQLLTSGTEALATIQIQRKATISEGMEFLLLRTSEALSKYIANVRQEVIATIAATNSTLSPKDASALLELTMRYFPDAIYTERFSLFLDSIKRHYSRAGINIDLLPYRPDLFAARQTAGCSTTISRFRSSFADDLQIIIQRQQNQSSSILPKSGGRLEVANKVIKLEPNFMGIGINFNYLIRRLFSKKE